MQDRIRIPCSFRRAAVSAGAWKRTNGAGPAWSSQTRSFCSSRQRYSRSAVISSVVAVMKSFSSSAASPANCAGREIGQGCAQPKRASFHCLSPVARTPRRSPGIPKIFVNDRSAAILRPLFSLRITVCVSSAFAKGRKLSSTSSRMSICSSAVSRASRISPGMHLPVGLLGFPSRTETVFPRSRSRRAAWRISERILSSRTNPFSFSSRIQQISLPQARAARSYS